MVVDISEFDKNGSPADRLPMKLSGAIVAAALLFLGGCGGGGGGAAPAAPASSPSTFTGAATVGELVSFTVDFTRLSYSYTILESQYGLAGTMRQGTLTANADGSYSLSGVPGGKLAVYNGILHAAIMENFNGVTKTVPVVAVDSPATSMAAVASTYNYESFQCAALGCANPVAGYGTFRINADATWNSCPQANIAANPAGCVTPRNGTLNSLGGGKWQMLYNGVAVGTALAYNAPNGQNVMVVDLKDPVTFGYGVIVGSAMAAVSAADVNGTWRIIGVGSADGVPVYGTETIAIANGNSQVDSNMTVNIGGTMKSFPDRTRPFGPLNSPWNGMVSPQAAKANPLMMAGTGITVQTAGATVNGIPVALFWIGVKQ